MKVRRGSVCAFEQELGVQQRLAWRRSQTGRWIVDQLHDLIYVAAAVHVQHKIAAPV